jgi:ankyrin repeat protein
MAPHLPLPISNVASAPPPQNGCTPLHFAAEDGLLEIIDKLLDMNANIEAKEEKVPFSEHDIWRQSIAACACGVGPASLLLPPHRPITSHLTLSALRSPATSPLASPHPCNGRGRLHTCDPPCCTMLLCRPTTTASPPTIPHLIFIQSTTAGTQGETPLHYAVHRHQALAVKRLTKKGADVDVKSNVHARPRRAPAASPCPAQQCHAQSSCALSTNTA